ncbi:trans-feruloyl-CoA synthase [Noviherbaspirillum humi]|uniref:Trans-feruloyl-CoA synthase n=1 Tax=Noviherbaspirillum humi TaxID=1688639 RepID=A0A239K3P4_9BURK|nr:feruloyl-CoA synthase [Noviherbaspirillum humi]SNT12755.1 trans-feruloyl-CoA synthase [Noviherbaspirillum humi]
MGDMIRDAALFAAPGVQLTRRADGSFMLEPRTPLEPYARCMGEYLERWARETPDRPFLQERGIGGQWQGVSYAQALQKVVRIATWLLESDLDRQRPVVVLSDNSIEHALLMLACMHIGQPYSAISPAYSLMSRDHAKLKGLIQRLEPSMLYVLDPARYSAALEAISGLHQAPLVVSDGCSRLPAGALRFSSLLASPDEEAVAQAFSAVGPDTIAKILFTSGSTSEPKGVLNTQRMLCSNQQAKLQLWPFLRQTPPVLLDWLPWNHTFGGNHNFNMVLANGGTLYIDGGKPMPGLFEASIANLREVAPTLYLNVPRGFDMLVPALRVDAQLRRKFFSRIQVIFYAAAALPQHLWDALIELSIQELGHAVPMVTAWGSTETAPLASDCNYQASRSGVIGLPIPGVTLKLVPNGEKLEVRVKGPNVTPGYFRQPSLSAKAFDEEGFYLIGDAVRFVDPQQPELGLLFDGRVAEDFKLSSGTWVSVGAMRVKAIELMAPVAQDIAIAGHDRNDVGMLVFANLPACRKLAELTEDAPAAQALAHPAVLARLREGMEQLREHGTGTSTYATRALLMAEPASVDAGEITDKGYINQAAVLRHRAALVERLYADPPDPAVILLQ